MPRVRPPLPQTPPWPLPPSPRTISVLRREVKHGEPPDPRFRCQASRLDGREMVSRPSAVFVPGWVSGLTVEEVGTAGQRHDGIMVRGRIEHIGDIREFLSGTLPHHLAAQRAQGDAAFFPAAAARPRDTNRKVVRLARANGSLQVHQPRPHGQTERVQTDLVYVQVNRLLQGKAQTRDAVIQLGATDPKLRFADEETVDRDPVADILSAELRSDTRSAHTGPGPDRPRAPRWTGCTHPRGSRHTHVTSRPRDR